ncbi:MAG: hypothetical protein EZS28_023143 [Streblomastix strix]|uniref:Tyr recombinase domain-containing protein n=1 Tax=Streblomastix strix TaxID=222440 RepID=A0A5J4VFH9_9EUKA|nr:MAG: hypothetical protein EZS28_023143 [Streblomastix strix]
MKHWISTTLGHISIERSTTNGAKSNYTSIQQYQENSGDGTENERQGSKASTRQCRRLPSGPVADVGKYLLMRCMKMRGFSQEGVNLLFKGQRFNTVKRNFYSLALLLDSLQLTKLLRELKIIGASAYSIRHSATAKLAKLGISERDLATFTLHSQNSRTVQQYYIFASSTRANDKARYLDKEMRQGEKRGTNYYPRLPWRQGNDLLSLYLLISPLAHPKQASQPEVKQKHGENSLEN